MEKDRKSPALGKPTRKSGGGSQHLSEEERALWEHAARDLKPLKAKKTHLHGAHDSAADAASERLRQADEAGVKHSRDRAQRQTASTTAAAKAAPPLSELDRRKARKIGSGKIEIEARIDLHGMRQSQAHTALRRFLLEAHARDRRWVLVITGKGGAGRRELNASDAADTYGASEPGVLRRNVPRWLAEPELRAIVVSYTTAAARHGGEGALYVQLRKRAR